MRERKNPSKKPGLKWGTHDAAIYLEEFMLGSRILPQPKGNRSGKTELYYNIISAFDIETTALPEIEQSFMYIWQWAFYHTDDDETVCIYGRTWEEWADCRDFIISYMSDAFIVVLVHNLSYEFVYLSEYYDFSPDEVFATGVRTPIKAKMLDRFEYRCTYAHSNTTLSIYLQQWHAEHQKLSGDDYDYTKIRWPDTPLTDDEMEYALHDVMGLCEAYKSEMLFWGDTLYTIPMTSTGYVRRECKRAWYKINFHDRISWMPNYDVVKLLREAFRGGDTHGSCFNASFDDHVVILKNVISIDRSSSYPDVLINCMFPLGNWYRLGDKNQITKLDEILKYVKQYEKAILCRANFYGLRMKNDHWPMPYIPKSKCGYLDNYAEDNGRIRSAEYCSITITDVDLEIIEHEYEWDNLFFTDAYYCRYRYLPDFFRDVVRKYYRGKTELKGYPDGSIENTEYFLDKALLNALYGMAAQVPIKMSLFYDHETGDYLQEDEYKIKQIEKTEERKMTVAEKTKLRTEIEKTLLDKTNKKAFMPYGIGVWTTVLARLELHRMMWEIDAQGGEICYCDTDSIKYRGNVDITRLNRYYMERSTVNGAAAEDRKGVTHYMGVYEQEYIAQEFAHKGAKKYVYTVAPNPNGKTWADQHGLHITIAGVVKDKGARELYEHGGFSAFVDGMKFVDAGGVRCVYNDDSYGWYEQDGHRVYIGRNVCLLPDYYTLGLAPEYHRLLEYYMAIGQFDEKEGVT